MRAARLRTREAFQASRGAAILIVVIFHADLALANMANYNTFTAVRDALRFIPMPLFFLSVGMSLAPAFERGHALPHCARRAVHYSYLFVVWTLIDLGVSALCSFGSVSPFALFKAFVHPDNGLWFLYGLAAQLVLLGLLASSSRYVQLAVALGLVFLSGYLHSTLTTGATGYMIFLVLGARFTSEILSLIEKASWWAITLCFVSYIFLARLISQHHPPLIGYIAVVASMVGICGIICLFRCLMQHKDIWILRYLGRSTFEIYILHTYFVIAFAKIAIWLNMDIQGKRMPEFPLPLASLIVGVCGSLLVSSCIRNIRWLFSKPHWVVAGVEPIIVHVVENFVQLGRHRRNDRTQSSGMRLG